MRPEWPFAGRQRELQLVADAQRDGTGGVVLAGEPGVGKTRLATEALGSADPRRCLSLWTAATPETAAVPLGAFAALLPPDPTPARDHAGLLRSAAAALAQRCGPRTLVLGVDDAHLLDELSATLAHHLVRTGRAFVVCTVLSRQAVPDPVRAMWKDGLARRIEVAPLDQAAAAEALAGALGGQLDSTTARRLWRTVRGSKTLLTALVAAGLDSGALTEIGEVWRWEGPWTLTPRLVAVICDRIGDLPRAEQDVLELLAYGEPIGADLLTALTGEAAVEAVEARNLLAVHQDGRRVELRLAQPLYGEVLRASCPPDRADRWRVLLADAVRAAGARRPGDLMRIASWRVDASLPVEPATLMRAAEEAFTALDLPKAERLARAVPREDEQAAGAVLWRVLLLAQRSTEAVDLLDGLACHPAPAQWRADLAAGRAYHLFAGLARAGEAFEALAEARVGVGPEWQAELDLLRCLFQVLRADTGPGLAGLAELAGRPGPGARVAAHLPAVHGMALLAAGRLASAQEELDLAAETLTPWTGDDPWLADLRSLARCDVALLAGRLAEATRLAAAFHDDTAERGWEFALRLSCGVQARVARWRGRVHTAARWAREGRRVHARLPDVPFRDHLLAELAHAEALAGHAGAAERTIGEVARHPKPAEAFLRPWADLAQPWVAMAAGDRGRAVGLALAGAAAARERAAAIFEAIALHDVVRLGAPRRAAERLHDLAGDLDSALVRTMAEHAAAAVAGDASRLEAVAAWFAAAGASLLAAEACGQAAQVAHASPGDAPDGPRLRTRAAVLLDGCEGARTPLVAGIEPPRLTPRERDVAALAAAGQSNQDIADRLVLSRRTVANHLHHVYAKLGVGDRAALGELRPVLH